MAATTKAEGVKAAVVGDSARSASSARSDQRAMRDELQVVFWDATHLVQVKAELAKEEQAYRSDIKRLKKAVKRACDRGPYSVMDKKEVPPSEDKHDYLSFSRYWWPDPDKPDGLPYIRHDGKVNRKLVDRGDRERIGLLIDDLVPLALASYLIEDDKAGKHAAKLLRVWFLDEATRMNPHLNYGQGVPGRSNGRGVGIIDTRGFIWLLDSIGLLRAADAISDEQFGELRAWFADYLEWLQHSALARSERTAPNNHGSWYAAQICRIGLFVDRPDVTREFALDVKRRRIPDQIADDGSQPYELKRTQSLHYSLFNLAALTVVARTGDQVGVDVWDSRLKLAAQYLAKNGKDDEEDWNYPQMGKIELSLAEAASLTLLAEKYHDKSIRKLRGSKETKDDDLNFLKLQFSLNN